MGSFASSVTPFIHPIVLLLLQQDKPTLNSVCKHTDLWAWRKNNILAVSFCYAAKIEKSPYMLHIFVGCTVQLHCFIKPDLRYDVLRVFSWKVCNFVHIYETWEISHWTWGQCFTEADWLKHLHWCPVERDSTICFRHYQKSNFFVLSQLWVCMTPSRSVSLCCRHNQVSAHKVSRRKNNGRIWGTRFSSCHDRELLTATWQSG